MKQNKEILSCVICGEQAEIYPDGMPMCMRCNEQMRTGDKSDIKRRIDALDPNRSEESIINHVCVLNRIDRNDIMRKSRIPEIIEARHMAMYLMRRKLCFTYLKIGDIFDQDHATVSHACKEIENRLSTNRFIREKYKEIL